MSAKLKYSLIVVLSIFATTAMGLYISLHQPSTTVSSTSNGQEQEWARATQAKDIVENPQRTNYKPIPLDSINSTLQGSDPADLALNAFDDTQLKRLPRKVEVYYPEPNQAMVTITQKNLVNGAVGAIKYRVELTTFGRSLLVSSPRVWQIVWAGVKSEELGVRSQQLKLRNQSEK